MTTIYDVAGRAGVSPATVSRVLNGRTTVDPILAERVHAAVAELGYRPNAVARNLRLAQTKLWAVVVSDIGNPFYTALVRGVEDVAQTAGYSVMLCNSDENPEKEQRYVAAVLSEQVAGVIISPSSEASGRAGALRQLLTSDVPVVAVDRELPDARIDTVLVDNESGAFAATAHLVDAGYERIACIGGPPRLSTAVARLRGYRAALGSAYDEDLVRHADLRQPGGYKAMRALLTSGPVPDAVFVTNNLMTVGALECLSDCLSGPDVPALGMVGFDDVPWAMLVRPSLTTVAQPTYELGKTAAQLLADRIADPRRDPTKVVLPTTLHIRESSTRPT